MTINKRPRVAIVLTSIDRAGDGPSGSWYEELAAPYYALTDAGIEVVLTSIKGGSAPIDPASREDQWQTEYTRRFDNDANALRKLSDTQPVAGLAPSDFDALFLCGGLAVMWDFTDSLPLANFVAAIDAKEGVVSSVCHGAAGLLSAKTASGDPIVKQRQLVSWTNEEERTLGFDKVVPFLLETALRDRGARFSGGVAFSNTVRVDGNLITGQNPASARAVGELLVKTLTARAAA